MASLTPLLPSQFQGSARLPRRLRLLASACGMLVLLPLAAEAQPAPAAPVAAAPSPTAAARHHRARPAPARAAARVKPVAAPKPVAEASGPVPLPTTAPVLTLGMAEKMLVDRNLTVVAARRGVDAARAQRLVASALPSPTLSYTQTGMQFNERNQGGIYGTRGYLPSNNFDIGLSMLVELGGKRGLRTRVADENISAAEAQVLDTLRTQLFQLRQAFVNGLLARANLEVALSNRISLDRTEALLRRQLRDGAIPEGDLLRFQASRVQMDDDVTTAAQTYAGSVATVATLLGTDAANFQPGAGQLPAMGINPQAPGSLAAPPANLLRDAPPPPSVPGLARPRVALQPTPLETVLSPVAFDLRGSLDNVPKLDVSQATLAQAVPSRPDVVAAERQAGAAQTNTKLAEAGRWRDVTVGADFSRSRLAQDQVNGSSAVDTVGLSVSIPLFTSQVVRGNIGVAVGQQGQAEAQAQATLLAARTDFATAWASYQQSQVLMNLYNQGALQRAQDAFDSTERAYFAGGRTLLDVMDALRTLNATKVSANQARATYLIAIAQLEEATGVQNIVRAP